MNGGKRSLGVLLSFLEGEGYLDAAGRTRGEKRLRAPRERGTHWSIQLLMGAGAWLAAAMLLGFFFATLRLYRTPEVFVPLGLVVIAGAAGLRRTGDNVFLAQLALAFSLAGQALAIGGTAEQSRSLGAATGMAAMLCAALQVAYPDPVHRALTWAVALSTGCAWLGGTWLSALHLMVALMALVVTMWATADRPGDDFRPAACVCAAGLPVLLFVMCFAFGPSHVAREQLSELPSRILLAVLLWQMAGWAARDMEVRPEPLVLARVAVALLACVGSAGLLAAGLLLVLGFDRQDRTLLALGGCALPLFLWAFYYDLRLTLAVKSVALIASGLSLLAGRMVLSARPWAHGGSR